MVRFFIGAKRFVSSWLSLTMHIISGSLGTQPYFLIFCLFPSSSHFSTSYECIPSLSPAPLPHSYPSRSASFFAATLRHTPGGAGGHAHAVHVRLGSVRYLVRFHYIQYNEDPVCKALSVVLGLVGVRATVDPTPSPVAPPADAGKKID